jgi:hypothetical protein
LYKVSYDISRPKLFCAESSATPSDNLNEVMPLLERLSCSQDSISISEMNSGIKTNIWWNASGFIFEVIRSDGIFFKECTKEQIASLLHEFDDLVINPKQYSFDAESL